MERCIGRFARVLAYARGESCQIMTKSTSYVYMFSKHKTPVSCCVCLCVPGRARVCVLVSASRKLCARTVLTQESPKYDQKHDTCCHVSKTQNIRLLCICVPLCARVCACVCLSLPVCACACLCVPLCASLCLDVPLCASVCLCVLACALCAPVCLCASPLCACVCLCVPVCVLHAPH